MIPEDFVAVLISLLVGLIGLITGFYVRYGKFKRWWLLSSTPILPSLFATILIPFSTYFICLILVLGSPISTEIKGDLFTYLFMPMFIIIILIPFFSPKWLFPHWLIWIEENHSYIVEVLKQEAKAMGEKVWEQHVQTQEGLEAWVQEVKQKHNIP